MPPKGSGRKIIIMCHQSGSCFFSGIHRSLFRSGYRLPVCPEEESRHAAGAISPLPAVSERRWWRGGDKWNSVALQLIIMPRLSLTDTGDLSRSHADTCISSRSGSACARAKDTHGSTSPYPALAVDLDVLFTLASVQRCHQVYLRAIFPFSAFTFFLSISSFSSNFPSYASSSSYAPTHHCRSPLQFISEEKALNPRVQCLCVPTTRDCSGITRAARERNTPLLSLAAAWLTRRSTTGSLPRDTLLTSACATCCCCSLANRSWWSTRTTPPTRATWGWR